MNTKTMKKPILKAVMLITALAMLTAAVIMPQSKDAFYNASYIERLENIRNSGLEQYFNSSVVQKLPSGISDDEEISVIISLQTDALLDLYNETDRNVAFSEFASESREAEALIDEVEAAKSEITSALAKAGVDFTLGEEYTTVLSGFEIVLKAGDFETLCDSIGDARAIVGEVYNVAETELVENVVNVYDTGIFNSSDVPYDGSGMVVAVLDTGLDFSHSAFSTDNFTSDTLGLTYEDVAKVIDETAARRLFEGLGVDDVYMNEKVPFGFDYADYDADVYSTHNNHGTHVSGVITGKDDTITGVAPNAQLVSMKIFSDVQDTAKTSWILSALEDCVILGVDVVNMSIGTACGFSRETDEEAISGVYNKIREAGISLVVAASNSYNSAYGSEKNGNLGLTSNPDTGTVGSPSTYDGALSVASINGAETPYILFGETIIYFLESNDNAANENDFVQTLLGDKDSLEIEYVTVPGVGRSADYTGLDVKGKIALVRRGDNTFEEKAMIAEAQGAAGIIIYNNVSGDIKMNVGEAQLAVCSISQDDGEMLVASESGTIKIAKSQSSGPFMSDFSSWGPTPNLGIKPEITAHGGNILSSVNGGSYDRLSGTSMACPNLAGVVTLLRQYVVENFPEIKDDNVKVAAMVNRLMMSTADIIHNTNGLPYSVRKQGAGLANLKNSIDTSACIITYNESGAEMDKTKLELGDDPDKTGEYTLNFTVHNFGDADLTYDLSTYVMTEGVSETKTSHGETTVTESAYILEGATSILTTKDSEGGYIKDNTVTVLAGGKLDLTVTIVLSDEDKKYLDESFENGMYVEGFVVLTATEENTVSLSVPYLAFYGDWAKAPLFDLDYYDTHADELDDSIAIEDKVMPDAYATRPIGGISDDYVSYLGSYYFMQDPDDMTISADRKYISLSNQVGAIHSLRFVWAGLLRNASKIEVEITDDATGETIFECVDDDVRKSYGDGGASIYPSNVEVEFDAQDYNLKNNSKYTVKLQGYLDYEDGCVDRNEKSTFEFPITIDFEAPTITDVEFYYEYDKTLEKNRLYAKVAVFDNHYTMAMQLGYVGMGTDEEGNSTPVMNSFEQYMTPVYSECDSTTYVTYELTDYIYQLKNNSMTPNTFVITAYDYALNYATYEIGLPVEYLDFCFEELSEGLTLSPNEIYTLEPLVYPDTEWAELLEFTSSKSGVARIVNNKVVACAPGQAVIKVRDPATNKSVSFIVTVLDKDDEGYRKYDKPVADVFTLTGYDTVKAYYIVNNDDKDIGDEGNVRFFEGDYSLSLYPSENVKLNYVLDAYFPNDTEVVFESSNESIVTVDGSGSVIAVAEGFASVTVKIMMDGKSTYYSESVTVEVKDPYITSGASLTHYYGNGGIVEIPARLSLKEIGNFAFSNFEYVMKSPEELLIDDRETSKAWFIGDDTITKVIIPEGVEKICAYAFANLTALEEVVFPSTLEAIDYGAFYGCTSLTKLTFKGENNLKIINQSAFESCNLKGTLELPSACVISDYAFAGNTSLSKIVFTDTLQSIGRYAFAGCKSVTEVTVTAPKVKYGAYVFTGCESLKNFTVNSSVIPEGMFYECDSLEKVIVGKDVNDIGEFAFKSTSVSEYEIESGNKAYKNGSCEYIVSVDGKTLVAVSPSVRGEFTANEKITSVAKGAFSHNDKLSSVVLPNVTSVGEYAFASMKRISEITLGKLEYVGEYAFFEVGISVLPSFDKDTVIGKYAFAYTDITEVTVPDGMNVAEGVFSECDKLEKVTVGDGAVLGKYAFNLSKDYIFEVEKKKVGDSTHFYYVFASALKSVTIGNDVVIGEAAFSGAASLESVTLGDNAEIGYMAFYNNASLKNIDLSKAKSIGGYAFSGDVYYVCLDDAMTVPVVNNDGYYVYTYHAPQITEIDLSSAESIGEYAFSYCRDLVTVKLGDKIKDIPDYAFAGTIALESINTDGIVNVGAYAFIESTITEISLPVAETIGEYAFVYCEELEKVTLGDAIGEIGEGAFSYCTSLDNVEGLGFAEKIDAYAFAYTAITNADLSGAVELGDFVFLKEELTPFEVTLGEKLVTLGDNPFAMCVLAPFAKTEITTFNGVDYEAVVYSFDISETVRVIDGSLYCKVPNGLELVVYAGTDNENVIIAEGTVRITAYAFAGSDAVNVTIPYTVESIGHKAFFGCEDLKLVVFKSYEKPVFEEEFDSFYYESYEHIPGYGDYGEYTDYDGEEVSIIGTGLVPYFMWNATDGLYSNVFYGANFIDYVGYVEDKIIMIKPSNGKHYDTYITAQYFDVTIEGDVAADDVTLAAIEAIANIPERVTYADKALVEAARAAYDKIATLEQQALVTNYAVLVSAEQRIIALTPEQTPEGPTEDPQAAHAAKMRKLIGGIAGVAVCVIAFAVTFIVTGKENLPEKKHKEKKSVKKAKADKKTEADASSQSEKDAETSDAEVSDTDE